LPRGKTIILDFTDVRMVDHTVLDHLSELANKYKQGGGEFIIRGLEGHTPLSSHPLATRVNRSYH